MARNATIFQIFIASPSDVEEERKIVREAILEWNACNSISYSMWFEPVMWETHVTPELSDRPQAIINREILDEADVLIGIFWTRIGSPSGAAESGTLEEIQRFVESNKPCVLFFSERQLPYSLDMEQFQRVKAFRSRCQPHGILGIYRETEEFSNYVKRYINKIAQRLSQGECETLGKGYSKKIEQKNSAYSFETDKKRLRVQADWLKECDDSTISEVLEEIRAEDRQVVNILDVGCADGYVTYTRFHCVENGKVLGIDISEKAINSANQEFQDERFTFQVDDITRISVDKLGKFDLIFCALTLHHLENPKGIVHKLWTMVNDNGALMIRGSDDGLKVNYPENDDLDFLLRTTNQVKGSSDREYGRKIYSDLSSLTPVPRKIRMHFMVDSTVGRNEKERLDYYEDNYSYRANYASKLAQRPNAKQEDKKLAEILRRIVKEQRERFRVEKDLFSVSVQNIAYALKGK